MFHLPVYYQVKDRPCLVVGGGEVAARKAELLLRRAARVIVVAPRISLRLRSLSETAAITLIAREFRPDDLREAWLAFAATDDPEINATVARHARRLGVPVNVADDPACCTFIMPSIIERAPVQIAVSTGGASPVLARLLRARLETLIPAAYGRLAALMAEFRDRARSRFDDSTARRRFWERILQGPIAEMLFAGREQAAITALAREFDAKPPGPKLVGEVYLVGAGPGDPDLLTFRALRLMQQADVVLYDRLVAPAVLDLVRRDAERIYVGKESSRRSVSQHEIHRKLVELARQGRRVLRLKGGDPFIFGRGGEEIDTLSTEGIPFQVVPGITAAAGCACYAGIPLTHRDYAQSCVFVAGHLKEGSLDLNWDALVQPRQTIAIYMGRQGLGLLCQGLLSHGMAADTPVALIQQGTTPLQRVIIGNLNSVPSHAQNENIRAPLMVIVGEVVRLHEKLAWFDPLGRSAETGSTGTVDCTSIIEKV